MLTLLIEVLCQVEISATGRALFWRIPTERDVSECDLGNLYNEEA